jgi:uncharacterized protein (TIGR02246 family)
MPSLPFSPLRIAPLRIALVTLAAAGLVACSKDAGSSAAPASDTTADAAAIKAVETNWNEALKANNLEAVLQHYAHDAVMMNPGQPAVTGADDIRAAMTEAMADPKFSLSFAADKVVVAQAGDIAYTEGKFTETDTNPKTKAQEKISGGYVTVYRKASNGSWKAVADIATPGPAKP